MTAARLFSLALLALAAACATLPDGARTAGRDHGGGLRRCAGIVAYLDDPDPAGRAVHARPDPRSPVLGRIAPPTRNEADRRDVAVGFDLLASRDGWLLVDGAADDTGLTGAAPRAMYGGRGWIRAAGVRVGLQTEQAFAAPRHSSALLIEGSDLGSPLEIAACDGNWVLGRWRVGEASRLHFEPSAAIADNPLTLEAWATGICNIQETSCDGVSGNRPGPRLNSS